MVRNQQNYGSTRTVFLFALSLGLMVSFAHKAEAMIQIAYDDGGVVMDSSQGKPVMKRANPGKDDIIKKGDNPGIKTESFDAWKKNAQNFSGQPTSFMQNDRYVSIKALVRANLNLPEDAIAKIVAAQYGYTEETAKLITARAIPIVAKEINLEAEERQQLQMRALARKSIGKLPPVVVLPPSEKLPYERPTPVMDTAQHGIVNSGPIVDTNSSEPSGTAWKDIDVPVTYNDPSPTLTPNNVNYYNGVTGSVGYKVKDVPYDYPMDPVAPTLETE